MVTSPACEHDHAVLNETGAELYCFECDARLDAATFEVLADTEAAEEAPKSRRGRPRKETLQSRPEDDGPGQVLTSELQQQVEAMAAAPLRGAALPRGASPAAKVAAKQTAGQDLQTSTGRGLEADQGPMSEHQCPSCQITQEEAPRLVFTHRMAARDGNSYFYKCTACGTVVSVMESKS